MYITKRKTHVFLWKMHGERCKNHMLESHNKLKKEQAYECSINIICYNLDLSKEGGILTSIVILIHRYSIIR